MSSAQQEHRFSVEAPVSSGGERLIRGCGLVIVVCVLAAGVVSPDPPSHTAADDAVLAFYQQHASGVLAGNFLWDLGMTALVLFGVVLSRACGARYQALSEAIRSQSPALLVADLVRPLCGVAAALFVVSQAVQGAAAVMALHGEPAAVIRSMDEISHITGHLGPLPLGSFLLAAGLAQKAARCGARWIAWLGIVAGSVLIATTSWVAFGHQWLHNAGVFALLAWLVWTIASSVSLLRLKSDV